MCFPVLPALAAVGSAIGSAATAVGSIASTLAPIAGLAGAGIAIAGNMQAARGAQAAAQYNALAAQQGGQAAQQQAEFNARLAEGEAQQARQTASFEEAARRERSRFLLADQRQRALASGVALEGSPLEVLAFNAGQYELDALAARYDGATRAQSLETEAAGRRYTGQLAGVSASRGAGVALLQGQTTASGLRQRALGTALSAETLRNVQGTARTVGGWLS